MPRGFEDLEYAAKRVVEVATRIGHRLCDVCGGRHVEHRGLTIQEAVERTGPCDVRGDERICAVAAPHTIDADDGPSRLGKMARQRAADESAGAGHDGFCGGCLHEVFTMDDVAGRSTSQRQSARRHTI